MPRLTHSLPFALPLGLPFASMHAGSAQRLPTTTLRTLAILTGLAALTQVLDLVTFLQVMAVSGPGVELNPIGRALFVHTGPAGIALVKLGLGLAVPALLASRARMAACVPLVRLALCVVVGIGVVGFTSNLATTYL